MNKPPVPTPEKLIVYLKLSVLAVLPAILVFLSGSLEKFVDSLPRNLRVNLGVAPGLLIVSTAFACAIACGWMMACQWGKGWMQKTALFVLGLLTVGSILFYAMLAYGLKVIATHGLGRW